jgi:hypothetical protein
MALPESIILSRYRCWRVFGTGTWSSPVVPRTNLQRKLLFAFLYETAKMAGIPFRRLVWASRHETGEKFGREHYHWLIGAEEWKPTLADMFRLNALWDSLPKCGFSRNHQFDERLNGVEYVTKCLSGSALRDGLGGDFYEGSKFALRGAEVTLSNALARAVGGRRIIALRHC